MTLRRAKDVTFSANNQADQTMVLDLESTPAKERALASNDEPTLVLDLSATQVRELLEDATVQS